MVNTYKQIVDSKDLQKSAICICSHPTQNVMSRTKIKCGHKSLADPVYIESCENYIFCKNGFLIQLKLYKLKVSQ